MAQHVLWRAAVIGLATGARSMTPIAALAHSGRPGIEALGGTWGRRLTTLAAFGELVTDKLPGTPSRLTTGPFAGRLACGALAGYALARGRGKGVVLPVLTAAVAAALGSVAGAEWRAYAARHGLAVPAAIAEDGAAVLLADAAAR
jgi:uncharacterized membrane protein